MTTDKNIENIQKRLNENAYFVNPLSDANVKADLALLLRLLAERDKKIEELTKKNKILGDHVAELTQEMENIKADFGNQR